MIIIIASISAIATYGAVNADSLRIDSLEFDYELVERGWGMDAVGPVTLHIMFAQDVELIHCDRSGRKLPYPDRFFPFMRRSFYIEPPDSSLTITYDYLTNDIHIRLLALHKDGEWEASPIYSINDYIAESDLEIIKERSGISDAYTDDDIVICPKDGCLVIDRVPCSTHIAVYAVDGRVLFNGIVTESAVIPIHPQPIIIRYTTNHLTITKKLLIK